MSHWPRTDLHPETDVVIVGAGVAGLNAAHHLAEAGLDVLILEAAETVGGRIRTDEVDGFLLDHGFQLYNPAYPEGEVSLDYADLDLKSFFPGAVLATADGPRWLVDPRRAPRSTLLNARVPLGPLGTARTLRYLTACAVTDPKELQQRPDISTQKAFEQAHLSGKPMDLLLRPFLSGVLADTELQTSRRFTDMVLRSLSRGTPAVPNTGMQAIPEQLARPLRSRIFRQTAALSVSPNRVETTSGPVDCEAVIVATDPVTAAALVPSMPTPVMRSLTTWYFSVTEDDLYEGKPVLIVDSTGKGPVTNTVVLSYAAPGYAPPGRHLVQATAVGLHDGEAGAVRSHLAQMYAVPTDNWELIGHYPIVDALPAANPPYSLRSRQEFDGVLVAGDHRDSPSIQGALVSGRRAADKLRRRLA